MKFKVLFSCFEPNGIKNSRLEIKLSDGKGKIIGSQSVNIVEAECGKIIELAQCEFSFPALATAKQYFIEVSFADIKNKWPIWSFPEMTAQASNVIETGHLDNILIDKISKGASCILYGNGPFSAIGSTWQLAIAGRTEGNLATVINEHPIFDHFPHEGWCNWYFADMLNNTEAMDLTTLNLPVSPIIERVSSFKKIKRQAMIFELKAGEGYLIVCTLNLGNSPIAGAYLKAQLQAYAASDKKGGNAPVIEPYKLKEIINHKYSSQSVSRTDEGFDALEQLKV